ncbi:hypothetical protein AB0451_33655 [Streptomyces sp. NPDC052000]
MLSTIYAWDRLHSPTIADRFATWNQRVRPLPSTAAPIALLVACSTVEP